MRVVVLSDIHANLRALDAILGAAGAMDAVWHLGDVVGYGPDPDAVVDRLRERGAIGVQGNHDLAATGDDVIRDFNPDARAAMEWTRRTISPATRDWLAALPWDRTPPPPHVPDDIVIATSRRYVAAYERVTGRSLADWYGAAP